MRYLRVRWFHEAPDEPVELYSELDDRSFEVRKVEVFADGRMGFAEAAGCSESTQLGLEPLPSFEEIAADNQFVPEWISRDEFEDVWESAHQTVPPI